MTQALPCSDDRPIWDLHLSHLTLPTLITAIDVGVFDALATEPASAEELAQRLNLNARAMRAILPLLASAQVLLQRLGQYHLTETAREFLVRASPYFWGPVFELMRDMEISPATVLRALKAPPRQERWELVTNEPTGAWSAGEVAPEAARAIAAYMNSNSLKIAHVAAQRINLTNVQRLLDVGAGSGCFSIAFALANPQLRCTLMDLKGMGEVAMDYVRAQNLSDRIDTLTVDMFREPWPQGYDALFLSNILHDWDFEACGVLARKAFEALPSGGRILVHEALLDDTHDGPHTPVAFSVYMLLATKGQQFTFGELKELLTGAGFRDIEVSITHGYYSVVSALKP